MSKTFDIVSAVIEAKSDELKDTHKINEKNVKILSDYCAVVDIIVDDGLGESISADIRDDNLVRISVRLASFLCQDEDTKGAYLGLMERAISIHITSDDKETVIVEFVFPSVFDGIQ